ncbi:MAG: polysaccharide deacetylase family protein [Candidatus Omnitrophica bacterium]|nr:polysaccharide deacetylase family protein [Candidatus Omnitrophota bacterium]
MKKFEQIIIVTILFLVIIGTYGTELYGKYTTPIIMYHNVEEKTDVHRLNGVGTSNFEYQMSFLKRNHYNVISLDALVEAIVNNEKIPHNTVVLTFDDGYEDNYLLGFPILKKYGFPATIFISSAKIGTEGYLTWDQIREMEQFGIMAGSHTLSHVYLPGVSEEEQIKEIRDSKRAIERKVGHPIYNLCYPTGGFNDFIKKIAKDFGYKSACTTNRGYDQLNKDVYELNRIRFGDRDISWPILRAKLSGFYNFFRSSVDPY